MPGMPLMPGVIMCEAAAQLSSYYAVKHKLMDGMMGFGGMEEIRFRGVVRPGDRFVIVTRMLKVAAGNHDLRVPVVSSTRTSSAKASSKGFPCRLIS